MKRFAFATVSLIMVASSCSKVEVRTGFSPLETSYVIEVTSLPVSENENPYFVDVADVDKYVDFRILESLSKGKVIELKSVEPIHSESGEISMYVIRYNEGWEVISSDKRTPLVLASAESGEFEYSSPVIQQIRMNWGYANEYLNDNLYTLTGDWTIVVNCENRAYNYRRELIYGFSNMQ